MAPDRELPRELSPGTSVTGLATRPRVIFHASLHLDQPFELALLRDIRAASTRKDAHNRSSVRSVPEA